MSELLVILDLLKNAIFGVELVSCITSVATRPLSSYPCSNVNFGGWMFSWVAAAFSSAVFAALTSVLAKVGIQGVESNLTTAIRTMVVLVIAWGIVIGKGNTLLVRKVRHSELLFLVASGIATSASWLFFYYAIQVGQVSVVVQIDKLSLFISILFASDVFKERLSRKSAIGLVLIVVGTAIVAACS